jgi:ketosteroid isomerase-like protein
MSQENVERLRAMYSEWAQGNFRAGGELLAEDVVFEPMADGRKAYLGRDAVEEQMREFSAQWSEFRVEAQEFVDVGETILVTERQYGKGKKLLPSGRLVDSAGAKADDAGLNPSLTRYVRASARDSHHRPASTSPKAIQAKSMPARPDGPRDPCCPGLARAGTAVKSSCSSRTGTCSRSRCGSRSR